ncbi:hypothetical protein EEL49_08855 [Muribaculaceae bacterium Isolate-104 (HZI)]|nr:hypothetical protein EEL49_08855 [Muribaculaceae bacterium Isolate-104 (HZI)]
MSTTELSKFQEEMHEKERLHAETLEQNIHGDEPIYDGVCDINGYAEAPIKVMWVLKEPWEKREKDEALGGWYIWEPWTDASQMNPVWKTMMYVMYGINTGIAYSQMPSVNDKMLKMLKSSAYINISKLPGKTTSTSMRAPYEQWREILLEQIKGYKPDVIIFGNTYDGLFDKEDFAQKALWAEELSSPGIIEANVSEGTLLINAWHPSPMRVASHPNVTEEVYVDTIVKAVRGFKHI